MTALKQLVRWSRAKQLLSLAVQSSTLPLRTLFVGRLFYDPPITKMMIFTPGGGMDGQSVGATILSINVAAAEVDFSDRSTDEAPVVRIVLKASQPGANPGDWIEIVAVRATPSTAG